MASTQLGSILDDFVALFNNYFTVGQYIQIDELRPDIDYYASCVFTKGEIEKHITNQEKFTYEIDLVIYINNINNDLNTRIQYVCDSVLNTAIYSNDVNFQQFCGNYQLINAGVPVRFRTAQGLLLDNRQEMVVFTFVFYKN